MLRAVAGIYADSQGTNLFFHIRRRVLTPPTRLQSNSVILIIKIYVRLRGRNHGLSLLEGVSSLRVSRHQSMKDVRGVVSSERRTTFMIQRGRNADSEPLGNAKRRHSDPVSAGFPLTFTLIGLLLGFRVLKLSR